MTLLILIYSTTVLAGIFLFIFLVDYIKNIYKFELLLQKLFRNFLRIEKASLNFSKTFFHFLNNEMKSVFYAKTCFFFLAEGNRIWIESVSGLTDLKLKRRYENNQNPVVLTDIVRNPKLGDAVLKEVIANYTEIPHQIFQITREGKLTALFLFIYNGKINQFRANKILLLHSRKLREIILDLTTVIRDREQNISISLLSSMRDYAFITVDPTFFVTSWNRGAELMFGCDCGDSVTHRITDFIEKESRPVFDKAFLDSENQEEVKFDLKMRDSSDTLIRTEVVLKRITIEEDFTGLYIVIKDVTKEEIWKENIRRQSMINKSIVDNARDGMMLLNEENRIIFLNDKLRYILDSELSMLGMVIDQVIQKAVLGPIKEKLDELKNSMQELSYINLMIENKWYLIRFFPIKNEKDIQGAIIFFIDNTEQMNITHQLEEMNTSLIDNLNTARLMHKSLIPAVIPKAEKLSFDCLFLPSETIGGDFYYIEEVILEHHKYYLILEADVSGHGVGASMLTVLVKDVYNEFRILLDNDRHLSVSLFLELLNKKMINLNMDGNKFVTVFIAILDPEKKQIRSASAGHPSALILCDGAYDPSYLMTKKAPPCGVIEEYPYRESNQTFASGCRLIVYTDGLVEIFKSDMDVFLKFIREHIKKDVNGLKIAVQERIQLEMGKRMDKKESPLPDDITVVFAGMNKDIL